jgi:hypothetical protein
MESLPFGASERIAANVGGYQLGGIIGRALGGEDPQLKMISQRQAINQGINLNDPESIRQAASLSAQVGDQAYAYHLVDVANKVEATLSQTQLREAQAKKALNWQQTQTDSAQKRSAVANLEKKLATEPTYQPSAEELASVRWIIANESKSKTQIDPTTGQLYVIEGLNINDAAPNLANFLKSSGIKVPTVPATAPTSAPTPVTTTGEATTMVTPIANQPIVTATSIPNVINPSAPVQVAKGVTAVPTAASQLKAKEESDRQIAKLEEDTRAAESMNNALSNIKSVRKLITDTSNLVNPLTTGLTGKVLSLGSTEARVLENNNSRIRANAVFEELANLKSQSKTGATGFGALNLEELRTIQNKAATLDPVSPNYKNDLADIDKYFAGIEKMTSARTVRAEEKIKNRQGANAPAPLNDEAKIQRFIDFNGGKPTKQQAIDALRKSGVIK